MNIPPKQDLRRLRNKMTLREMSEMYNVSITTINRWCATNGINSSRIGSPTRAEIKRIKIMRKNRKSIAHVTRELNSTRDKYLKPHIKYHTVWRHYSRLVKGGER